MAEDKLLIEKTGTTLHIPLGYQLSVENAPDLQAALGAYQNEDIEEIVFDASDLVFLSSIGIRVIVFSHNKFKQKPKIVFVNCAKAIYDTLDLVGITGMISFVETERAEPEIGVRSQEPGRTLPHLPTAAPSASALSFWTMTVCCGAAMAGCLRRSIG